MTWTWCTLQGGESRDNLIDGYGIYGNMFTTSQAVSIITSPVKTGTGAVQIGLVGQTGYTAPVLPQAIANKLTVIEGFLCFAAPPPAIYAMVNGYWAPEFQIAAAPNGRLALYTSAGGVSKLGPWSQDALACDGLTLKHFAWVVDPIIYGSAHVMHYLFIDFKLQWAVDGGAQPAYDAQHYLRIWSTVGAPIYADDICAAYSTDGNDAPHLARLPIGKVMAQRPSGAGLNAQWLDHLGGAGVYTEWDEATGNDGDATYNTTNTTSKLQDSDMQSAGDLGWAATAAILHNPIHTIVHKQTAGTKWKAQTLCNLAAARDISGPANSYVGHVRVLPRSSGTWAPDDLAALYVGAQTGAADHDETWRLTMLLMQWLYSEASLPLVTAGRIGRRYGPKGIAQVI